MARCELLEEVDLPFPLGGCFGYWGYDLRNFVEPKLPRRAANDLELPDCHVGFYDSLVVFDHQLDKTWVVSTGLAADGSRSEKRAGEQLEFWRGLLSTQPEQFEAIIRHQTREQLPPLPGERAGVRGSVNLRLPPGNAVAVKFPPTFPARIFSPPFRAPSNTSAPAIFTR